MPSLLDLAALPQAISGNRTLIGGTVVSLRDVDLLQRKQGTHYSVMINHKLFPSIIFLEDSSLNA